MKKTGRNEKCSCESGQKYKYCCMEDDIRRRKELEKEERVSVYNRFSVIRDPRDNRGKKYLIMDLLIMVIYGILNGYEDFDNLADFLHLNEKYFKKLLLIDKTPSHDCLSHLFAIIDAKEFMDIFVEWIKEVVGQRQGSIIALDGKAIKSARDKINGGNTPYILSAYLSEIGISIGQVEVGKKSNEITAIPELLKIIDVKGNFITIDAVGTQENITRKIVSLGGHFVLKVKGNQKTLMNDLQTYFYNNADKTPLALREKTKPEKNHGRGEYREYYISHNVGCITNKEKWDKVASIGMVRVHRRIEGKISVNEHYYIMDTKIEIGMFKKCTRLHWNIECGLHWRLDVIMNEDHSRNRMGNSISNLSIIRKIVFNLIRLDTSFGRISFKKKMSRYRNNFEHIENLIFNMLPNVYDS